MAEAGTEQDRSRSAAGDDLDALRARLDRIDESLLDLLRRRIECCVEIAHVKRENGVPMMQPHRIGLVQRRAACYGKEHGLNLDFLRRVYDLIIDETCRVEDLVINDDRATQPALFAGPPGHGGEGQLPCARS